MTDPAQAARAYYDRVASREQARLLDVYHASESLVLRRTVNALLAGKMPLAIACEVGCGPGHYVPWLRRIAARVLCLDVSEVELRAVPADQDVIRVQADARRLPLASGSVDAMFLLGPHYHLPDALDRRQMTDEAVRVLASGGWVVIAGLNRTGIAAKMIVQRPARAWKARSLLGRALRAPIALPENAFGDFPPAFLTDPQAMLRELSAAGLTDAFACGSESWTVLAPFLTRLTAKSPTTKRVLEAVLVRSARGRVSLTLSEHVFAFAKKPDALS